MLEQLLSLLADVGGFLAQAPPFEDFEHYPPPQPQLLAPTFSFGQLIALILIGVAASVLFGFWAKSKAEEHGINPWVGFAAGFFFAYLGVRIVPLLRPDRLVNAPNRRAMAPQPPMGTNPAYRPVGAPLPGTSPPSPGPAGQPVPVAQASALQADAQPDSRVVVADDDGCFNCQSCGARVKAGRRVCMTCGGPLPNVLDPTTL